MYDNGWTVMFAMLTLCSWLYYRRIPLKVFKYAMISTAVMTVIMATLQVLS